MKLRQGGSAVVAARLSCCLRTLASQILGVLLTNVDFNGRGVGMIANRCELWYVGLVGCVTV